MSVYEKLYKDKDNALLLKGSLDRLKVDAACLGRSFSKNLEMLGFPNDIIKDITEKKPVTVYKEDKNITKHGKETSKLNKQNDRIPKLSKNARKGVIFSVVWVIIILMISFEEDEIVKIVQTFCFFGVLPVVVGWGLRWIKMAEN